MLKKHILVCMLLVSVTLFGCYKETEDMQSKALIDDEIKKCLSPQYYSSLAISSNNISICQDSRDVSSCEDEYYLYGFLYREVDVDCKEFNQESHRIFCKAAKENNPSVCGVLQNKVELITCKVWLSENPSVCEPENKDLCIAEINKKKAYSKNDASFCKKISEDIQQSHCFAVLRRNAPFYGAHYEMCEDAILSNKGITKYGVGLCDSIKSEQVRKKCLNWADKYLLDKGTNSLNKSWCNKILSKEARNACMSVINYDIEACSSVKNMESRFFCIVQLGEYLNDISFCERLKNESYISRCYDYFKGFRIKAGG